MHVSVTAMATDTAMIALFQNAKVIFCQQYSISIPGSETHPQRHSRATKCDLVGMNKAITKIHQYFDFPL